MGKKRSVSRVDLASHLINLSPVWWAISPKKNWLSRTSGLWLLSFCHSRRCGFSILHLPLFSPFKFGLPIGGGMILLMRRYEDLWHFHSFCGSLFLFFRQQLDDDGSRSKGAYVFHNSTFYTRSLPMILSVWKTMTHGEVVRFLHGRKTSNPREALPTIQIRAVELSRSKLFHTHPLAERKIYTLGLWLTGSRRSFFRLISFFQWPSAWRWWSIMP